MQRDTQAPFETPTSSNTPDARFSPDLRSITLIVDAFEGRQVWRLPYPAGQKDRSGSSGDVPGNAFGGWSWFPDGRNGIWSFGGHLWMAGGRAGVRQAVTTGISSEFQSQPALSTDGKQLLFMQSKRDYLIVSASLSDASVERILSSEVVTGMPAWALHRKAFVYTSDRSGSSAIWMRGKMGTTRSSPPTRFQRRVTGLRLFFPLFPRKPTGALHARRRRQRRSVQLDLVACRRSAGQADQCQGRD